MSCNFSNFDSSCNSCETNMNNQQRGLIYWGACKKDDGTIVPYPIAGGSEGAETIQSLVDNCLDRKQYDSSSVLTTTSCDTINFDTDGGYDDNAGNCNSCYKSSQPSPSQENYCSPCTNRNFDYQSLNKAYLIQKKYNL